MLDQETHLVVIREHNRAKKDNRYQELQQQQKMRWKNA